MKTLHYICKVCPEVRCAEGGFSVAGMHFKRAHPGLSLDVDFEMRKVSNDRWERFHSM